ncbi:hypothetical protein BDZ97DRAFT_1757742 [Flammula alnicola]|nr:hypothetical protein BDZ97DRAFT_1757742 [Flammula alnicola]
MPASSPGEQQEELDVNLKAIQPFLSIEGVEMPLWTSYINWLRLITAHFDAVDILIGYITGPLFQHETVSIQIVVALPVNGQMVWDPLSAKANAGISNTGILEFLKKSLDPSSTAKVIKMMWSKKDVKLTITNLEKLKFSNLLGWRECATNLLVKLKAFQAHCIASLVLYIGAYEGKGKGQPFTVRGSHNTITACTLPTWISGHIVDSMNKSFGGQLRQELVDLIDRSELLQNLLGPLVHRDFLLVKLSTMIYLYSKPPFNGLVFSPSMHEMILSKVYWSSLIACAA